MSKCWICGKEMTKTIGGCEQCNDCGVGLDDLVFRTRNHSKDNSLDKFVEKYPTYIEALDIIDDLKKQLERHNKYFNSFSCDSFDEFVDFISTFMLTPHEEQTLIKDLKKQLEEKDADIIALDTDNYSFKQQIDNLRQQLHDLPKKIVEEIRDVAGDYWDFNICEECGNVPDLNTLTTKDFDEILDTILKDYQK